MVMHGVVNEPIVLLMRLGVFLSRLMDHAKLIGHARPGNIRFSKAP